VWENEQYSYRFTSCNHSHVHIIIKLITNKGLTYFTLHVMSLYTILVSPFKLNYWNKWTFAQYLNFSSFSCMWEFFAWGPLPIWNCFLQVCNCKHSILFYSILFYSILFYSIPFHSILDEANLLEMCSQIILILMKPKEGS